MKLELRIKEVEREILRIVKSMPDDDLARMLSVVRVFYPVR